MIDYEDEEDELQLLLEGREAGDDRLVQSALDAKSKSVQKKKNQSDDKKTKKKRRPVLNDLDDDDEDDGDGDEPEDNREVRIVEDDEVMNQYVNEFDEDEDDGHPKFDEAMEVPESGGKAKKDAGSGKKKIVRNPRVILNFDVLKHVDGVAALPSLFKQIKFKGKGCERDDLNTIMSMYERWAHRLMPSLQFDDFIEKAENLTRKANMKTFLTKIRNDMPLDLRGAAGDFVNDPLEDQVPSDQENFEPISYFPDKEFSFSDDDDQLLASMPVPNDASSSKPIATSDETAEQHKKTSASLEDDDAEYGGQVAANLIARSKRKASILEDDDGEPDEAVVSNKSKSTLESQDETSQSSDIVAKRKRVVNSDLEDDSESNSSNDVDTNSVRVKRRKLVIDEDDAEKEEFESPLVTESAVKQTEQTIDASEPPVTSEFKDKPVDESNGNEVTEDEFLALLNN
jgi:hypothetical protein